VHVAPFEAPLGAVDDHFGHMASFLDGRTSR
jgi:hypothetical protein